MEPPPLNPTLKAILSKYSQKPIVILPSKAKPTPVKPVPVKPVPPPIQKGLVKALLIGINYETLPELRLNGCINDVINTKALVETAHGITHHAGRATST